jgi:predicted RNase H-like nuclease (RuvC/YqgF family)
MKHKGGIRTLIISYTFKTHITDIFEKEYQYQILPNSKETILFVDYVYFELKKLLKQRVFNFKRSGEGLNNNTIKRMKRRVYELDLKLSELQRKNTRTHEDVENIKANVEQLNAKIFQMNGMIEELKGQLRVQ